MGRTCVKAPITVDGREVWGLVDSGADQSMIDYDFCVRAGLKMEPRHGSIGSAFTTAAVSRIGVVNVVVEHGDASVACTLEMATLNLSGTVAKGEPAVVALIGIDLMPDLGMSIIGVQPTWPGRKGSSMDLQPLTKEDNLFQFVEEVPDEERRRALKVWKPLIEENMRIPPTARCTLPGAMLRIPTGDAAPISLRQYPLAPHVRQEVDSKVADWLNKGVIEVNSQARWAAPIVVAPKKDEFGNKVKYRICMDLRKLNDTIVRTDDYPVPKIEHVFMKIGGKRYYTTLDMADGYHQISLHEADREKVAFIWNGVHYQFTCACFGLKTMTSMFQRLMSEAMADLQHVEVYVDDLTIGSNTIDDHIDHVATVIKRLNAASIRLNVKKCHFCSSWARALGHVVSRHGRHIDPDKVRAIVEWPRPTTVRQLLTFLGSTGWNREYTPQYAQVAAPLDALRQSRGNIEWTSDRVAAFEGIKKIFRDGCGMLHFPDMSKPLHLYVDASQTGLGAYLYQVPEENAPASSPRVIYCISRSLRAAEKNYSATKRELLGLIWAIRRLKDYLHSQKCFLHTDHKPLTYFMTQKHVSPMLNTWVDELSQYDLAICHIPGKQNDVADALSRRYEIGPIVRTVSAVNDRQPVIVDDQDLPELQAEFGKGVGAVMFTAAIRNKQLIPTSKRRLIIQEAHAFGHGGVKVMQSLILNRGYWWPRLRADLDRFVQDCDQCMRNNAVQQGYHPLRPTVTLAPLDMVGVDLITPLTPTADGYNTLLVIVDYFTRFTWLKPCVAKSKSTIGKALWEVFTAIGFPKRIRSDNGGEFVNSVLDAMRAQFGIVSELVPAYEHQGNGAVERVNRTVREILRKQMMAVQTEWIAWVPFTQYSLNIRPAELTGSSPYSLMFGRSAELFGHLDFAGAEPSADDMEIWQAHLRQLHSVIYPGIVERAALKQHQMVGYHAKQRRIRHNRVADGTVVFVKDPTRTSKMDAVYEGPFVVVGCDAVGAYVVRDQVGDLLRRHIPAQDLRVTARVPSDEGTFFVVDSIIRHERVGDGYRYLVRWKDADASFDQWVLAGDFADQAMIAAYWKALPVAPGLSVDRQSVVPVAVVEGSSVVAQPSVLGGAVGTGPLVTGRQSARLAEQRLRASRD